MTYCTPPADAVSSEYRLLSDLHYGTDLGTDLDLYLPTTPLTEKTRALMMVVHGGGFQVGSKSDASVVEMATHLVKQGYAVASINYRLIKGTVNISPAPFIDATCAVRWLKANANTYSYDAQKVIVFGDSAGGTMGAMLAAAPDAMEFKNSHCLAPDISARIAGAVLFYPATDFRDANLFGTEPFFGLFTGQSALKLFLNGTPAEKPQLAALSSPITYVGADTSPLMITHGSDDTLVFADHSRDLRDAMTRAHRPVTYVEVPHAGHAFLDMDGKNYWAGAADYRTSLCATLNFLQRLTNE
jgi:acetyl esterase/lipase